MARPEHWLRSVRRWAARHPLPTLLALAVSLRLLAALFSGGFLTHDDHYVVVVTADRIAEGVGVSPGYQRSVLYTEAVALLMRAGRAAGITARATEMLIVRVAHALLSLLVVYFAFRILQRAMNDEAAWLGGVLTAGYFVVPVTAVHQFEEVVCQVPLLAACWWAQRAEGDDRCALGWGGAAGAALGLALVIRIPLASFVAPFFALLLIGRLPWRVKAAVVLGFGVVLVLQGWSNAIVNGEWWYTFRTRLGTLWREPVALLTEAEGYPKGPPWRYVLTLSAAFIPPFSLFFLAAIVRGTLTLPRIALSTMAFIAVHSLIANKQERFLLPVLPLLLLLGAAGAIPLKDWAIRHGWARTYRGLWGYFWTVNAVALGVSTFSPGHNDRIAPLVTIAKRGDATGVLVLQLNHVTFVPEYYLGPRAPAVVIVRSRDSLAAGLQTLRDVGVVVNYAVLYSDAPEADRVLLERQLGTPVVPIATIPPSLGDRLAHAINPHRNKASVAVVLAISATAAAGRSGTPASPHRGRS